MVAAAQIQYVLDSDLTALIFAPSHGATSHIFNAVNEFQRGKDDTFQLL